MTHDEWVAAYVYSGSALPLESWSHVAVTSDGQKLRLYVDGEQVGERESKEVEAGEGQIRIGGNPESPWDEFFDGRIDEIRVYNRALSEAEISQDRQAPIQAPPSKAPVARYSFDENEGAVAHDSAGDNDAGIEGAQWTSGRHGSALEFDAEEGDLLNVPDAEELRLEDFTLQAWVDPSGSREWAPALSKTNPQDYGYALYAGGELSGHPEGVISQQKWVHRYVYEGQAALPSGEWSHLALTSDGTSLKLYVHGELVDTRSAAGVQAGAGPLLIGGGTLFAEEGEFFDGKIDEVRVHNRALSDSEVEADYESQAPVEPPAIGDRIQEWEPAGPPPGGEEPVLAPYFDPPAVDYEYEEGKLEELRLEDEATEGEDPSLDLQLEDDLVIEVESAEAGDTSYDYEGDELTAVDGPEGETEYGHDAEGRLTSIELPNGTTATITYDGTSRATAVKVDPAGPEGAKTTNFFYKAEPRQTKVWGGGNPEITYDIGEDGSVLKWAWAETPPTIEPMSGSLISKNGQEIEKYKDHTLFVPGDSPHGIGSIKVLINGSSVAIEETCKEESSPPDHHCDRWTMPWVTSAADLPPGRLDLEVIVTDLLGHQSSERFYVLVSQPDPPDPNAVPRPDFDSIKLQREENGLDREKSLSTFELTELILELLFEWESRDYAPVRAVEEFGVPMRAPELAEMEYRRAYTAQASEAIAEWAEVNAPSTYGGYYVDDRAGGIIHVGFTGALEQQAATVAALKSSGVLMAPDRVEPMPVPPQHALVNVESLEQSVASYIDGNPTAASLTASVGYSADTGKVLLESTNPSALKSILDGQFGAGAPIEVTAYSHPVSASYGRFSVDRVVYGGSWILNGGTGGACTANYSGETQVGVTRGQPDIAYFKLTAGHCSSNYNVRFWRKASRSVHSSPSLKSPKWAPIGRVKRSGFANSGPGGLYTDALGIEVGVQWKAQSSRVFYGNPHDLLLIYGMSRMRLNRRYCWSGMNGGLECGKAFKRSRTAFVEHPTKPFLAMWMTGSNIQGDSGAPVWDAKTKKAVGIVSGGADGPNKNCVPKPKIENSPDWCPLTIVTPLLPFHGKTYPIGAMQALGVGLVRG